MGINEQARDAALTLAPRAKGKIPHGEYEYTPSDVYITQMQNFALGMYTDQIKRHFKRRSTS